MPSCIVSFTVREARRTTYSRAQRARALPPRSRRRLSSTMARSARARGRCSSATRRGSSSSSASRCEFISGRLAGAARARPAAALAAYVGAEADDLTFVQNATTGVNMAARALELQPGRRGARDRPRVRRVRSHVGASSASGRARATSAPRSRCRSTRRRRADLRRRTERTRASTSRTSRRRPGCCCRSRRSSRARARSGLITIVDGAHAAGAGRPRPRRARRGLLRRQLPQVAVRAEGRRLPPRAPRVAGARRRPDRQLGLRRPGDVHLAHGAAGHARPGRLPRRARRDRVPVESTTYRERCVALAREARRELCELLGTEPLAPDARSCQLASRAAAATPQPDLSQRLFDEHRIEIPTHGPAQRRPAAHLGRGVHGAGGRRAAARRPPRAALELPAALRDLQPDERTELGAVLQRAGVVFTGFQKPTPEMLAVAPSGCHSVVTAGHSLHERVPRGEHLRAAACRSSAGTAAPGMYAFMYVDVGTSNSSSTISPFEATR